MGLQGKGESSKFEVWRASLRLGGVLEERVTACHGVSRRVGGWPIAGTCTLNGHFFGI